VPHDRTHGDRRARFEQVALPVAPALYRTAHRLSRRAEDARDLVQETFLRAYRTFDSFQEGTNARAWLFTILYSIVTNRWRADGRLPDEVALDAMDLSSARALASPEPDAEQVLLRRLDASPEIDRALRALPETQRAAVLMVDVEELTYEEAAGILDCPVGTVRSRLARGRRQLLEALTDYARRTRMIGRR
jgi:RNA polymerase sigma-70 factor (ECF subfamily)